MQNYDQEPEARDLRRRRGQALAEFAITLPILLILLFGIIEFGRIFQAWVTLQNAARTAARYASTGQYEEGRYNIDQLVVCDPVIDDLAYSLPRNMDDMISVTVKQDGADVTVETFPQNVADGSWQGNLADPSDDGIRPVEALFGTFYDGLDCEGGKQEHQQYRKDILRLLSIYDEARRGAAGLALEDNRLPNAEYNTVQQFFEDVWNRPQPGREGPKWFNVMVCSNRTKLSDTSVSENPNNNQLRFYTMLDSTEGFTLDKNVVDSDSGLYNTDLANVEIPGSWAPACILTEKPLYPALNPPPANYVSNVGIPWMDAGGPGDTVTIVVTFNHPLITPLGLSTYIPLQARRTAVNEAFRTAAVPLFNPPEDLDADDAPELTIEPPPPTDPPEIPTDTATPRPSNTPLPTATQEPFTCNHLHVTRVTFFGNRFYMEIRNDNKDSAWLTKSLIFMDNQAVKDAYPAMVMSTQALDGEIFWVGQGKTFPVDSTDGNQGTFYPSAFLEVPGGGEVTRWEGVFTAGPPLLTDYMIPYDFRNSTFWFRPMDYTNFSADYSWSSVADGVVAGDAGCPKALDAPPPPAVPTDTPVGFVPSPTFTPDCASSTVQIELVSFDPLGDVRLQVTNQRSVVAPFTDFHLVWKEPPSGDIALQKVVVGGSNANDLATNGGSGVVVWQGNPADADPATDGSNPSDGTWLIDFNFAPFTPTYIHLDFTGVGGATLASKGIAASDFNGSWFEIGCGTTGGNGGGPGTNPVGQIFISDAPTPRPTNTVGPTDIPGPTPTASNTFTPRPPTFTFTPRPPTLTFTPRPPTLTPTWTPYVLPTEPPNSGNE